MSNDHFNTVRGWPDPSLYCTTPAHSRSCIVWRVGEHPTCPLQFLPHIRCIIELTSTRRQSAAWNCWSFWGTVCMHLRDFYYEFMPVPSESNENEERKNTSKRTCSCLKNHFMYFNPRPDGEGRLLRPPPVFSWLAEKRQRVATPFYAYLISHPFRTFPIFFSPGNFMSAHQVWPSVPTSYKVNDVTAAIAFWASNMKPSGCDEIICSYEKRISDFRFRRVKVRSVLWPPHYKAMGEKPSSFYTHQVCLFHPESSYIKLMLMWSRWKVSSVTFIEVIWGHPRSPTGFC